MLGAEWKAMHSEGLFRTSESSVEVIPVLKHVAL
jgi:hypothetical protein